MNEEFEKWASAEGFDLKRGQHSGTYMNPETFVANEAWQASRKQALEEVVAIIEDERCDYCDVPNRVKALQKN